MSVNNVSNFSGIHIAEDYKEKWDKDLQATKSKLAKVTVPIGQSTTQKHETLKGLEIEKEDVTGRYEERKLTYSDDVEVAKAQEAFVKYGTENGQKVKEEDAEKMAKNYVENERHKEDVQHTQVFMDKKAYKAAEKQRKAEYKEMYNQYREDGYSKKEAKKMAKARSVENEYISGRKTRKFVEDNKDYFYDEKGNFSSDKFKQKAVEYANINTKDDETLNYHLSLRERRAAAQQERVSANVIKNIAKKSNLNYEKDNTNLYRGLAIGGGALAGAGIGSLFSVTSSAAAAAGSAATADAVVGGSAAASGSASAAAAAAASASVNGTLVGAGSGLAAGVAGSTFLRDNGKTEARVYAPGEKPVERHRPENSDPDTLPDTARKETPVQETPVVEVPQKECPVQEWEETYCDHKVKKGEDWSRIILGQVQVNGKKPQGNVLKALIHAEKIKHGITNFKLNTMPSTMRLYTDYSDLLENAEMMKKYPELKYLKDTEIRVDCDGKVVRNKYNGKPRVRYTRYTGTAMETNKYKQDCNDPVPVRINNK